MRPRLAEAIESEAVEEIANALVRVRITWPTAVAAGVVVVVGVVVSRLVYRYLRRLAVDTDPGSATTLRLLSRLAVVSIMLWSVGAALGILGFRVLPVLAMLSVVVVVGAVTFRPLLESFAAGVTLQTRRPFEPGDEVCLVGTEGVVREVTARTVFLETPTGEHVFIPNRNVLDQTIINYTAGGARLSVLELCLDYDTDLAEAVEVILAAARDTQGVHGDPVPGVFVHSFDDSGVSADIRFWHGPEAATARTVRHDLATNVKTALEEAGIVLASPQRTLRWAHEVQGSSGADSQLVSQHITDRKQEQTKR